MIDPQAWLIARVGVDRLLHYVTAAWITAELLDMCTPGIAILHTSALILLKELSDKYLRKSRFDIWDVVAGVAGMVTAVAVNLVKVICMK